MRFCDATATFGITAASLGIVYALAPTKRLVDIVGPARAKYMLFSARKIDAAQALAIGLVDEVFASGDLEAATEDFSGTVASKAQLSVRATKRIVGLILDGQVDDDENTRQLRAASFDSDDYREGVRAFLEKNTPHFT